MEMDFETFCNRYRDLKVNQKPIENLLEDILPTIKDLFFAKNHEVFYPEGIFRDKKLNLFFFTKFHINKVSILENSIEIQTWNYNEISNVKLIILDRFNVKIEITLRDGQQIELDSNNDTNNTWSNRFKEKIKSIYGILTNV